MELWSFRTTLGIEPAELNGMSVEARDGGIGNVVDLVDRIGAACLIVDTGPWIFGKKVLIPAGVVVAVDRAEARVFIDREKDEVKNAPEHDPGAIDDPAQRDALTAHYGPAPSGVMPEPGGAAPPAGTEEATTTPASFGGEVGLPSTPVGDSDAGTVHGEDEPASPTTIGAGWQRPEGSVGESLGAGLGDATTAPGGEQPIDSAPAERQPTGEDASFPPDEGPQADLAPQPSADLTDEPPAPSPDVPAKRRFARDEGSSADKAAPIARYDSLTAAEVLRRLPGLSQRELADLERYEKRHEGRRTVLRRIDSLREKEPWRGYDDETVDQIRKKLSDAADDRAKRVRDYERRHRDRKGVMEAARRAVASA